MRSNAGFTLIELLVVVLIITLLAALILPAVAKAMCSARQGAAEAMADQLSQAAKSYQLDKNNYPTGDGTDSKGLYEDLTRTGARDLAYYEFQPEMLDANNNILNPTWPGTTEIFYYRRNFPNPSSNAKNKSNFDIWAWNCQGQPGTTPVGTEADLVTNWN